LPPPPSPARFPYTTLFRSVCFIKESDAIVLFPGGFGTHDEGFEALTLMQTGKSLPKPLVFVDRPRGSYWKTWWRFVEDQLLDEADRKSTRLNSSHDQISYA